MSATDDIPNMRETHMLDFEYFLDIKLLRERNRKIGVEF